MRKASPSPPDALLDFAPPEAIRLGSAALPSVTTPNGPFANFGVCHGELAKGLAAPHVSRARATQHSVGSDDRGALRDGLLLAAVGDAGLEVAERGHVGQRHCARTLLLHHDVNERHAVLQPEAGVGET